MDVSLGMQAILAWLGQRSYRWTRWSSANPDWTHDHCRLCSACICQHRDDYPYEKTAHTARGCYRHAYRSDDEPPTWLCRNCYKRVRREART